MDPLVFEPYFRPQIWGGRRLAQRLGKPLPADGRFGESWEISAHRHYVTRVAEGPQQGLGLDELWCTRRVELVGPGSPLAAAEAFPVLLKYLDCAELLSVQVHPSDAIAQQIIPGERGKTEAWVVVEAAPTGRIYAGLKPGVTRPILERHLDAGTVDQCLHQFRPQPGDCVFLAAGTVHAVGGGVLMAEIQQSSDATFRLFDWNRLGDDGRPRKLHRAESLASIDWSAGPVAPAVPRALADLPPGVRGERLAACEHFTLDRYAVGGVWPLPAAGRLALWTVLSGAAELSGAGGYRRTFTVGQSLLTPATAGPLSWQPAAAAPAILLAMGLGT